jgi:hypothetical protein
MKPYFESLKEQNGSALIVAMLILVVLTILGLSATQTTQMEISIAGNQKLYKTAFHLADSGIYAVPKLINECYENDGDQSFTSVTYLGATGTFYRELMGFDVHDDPRDVRFSIDALNVDVDVNRTGAQNLPGGGVEFASGYEGIGFGSSGGVAVSYDLDSLGRGPVLSQANIVAGYRKVLGVPGGL